MKARDALLLEMAKAMMELMPHEAPALAGAMEAFVQELGKEAESQDQHG